jgi:radical SAM superfamily enzyme YgiQ (UPF0313 family)
MKCLLILPRCYKDLNLSIPSGIAVISAVLKKMKGVTVVNLNLGDCKEPEDAIAELLGRESFDMALCGGLYHAYDSMHRIFKSAKAVRPEIVTVAGGNIITGDPIPAMEALEFADYGMVGEGERTVVELATAVGEKASSSDMAKIAGLIIKDAPGSYSVTAPRKIIRDWSEIPWPDYEGFGLRELDGKINYLYSIMAGRGCPNRCTFCHNSQGKTYRERPLDDFFGELEYAIKYLRPHQKELPIYVGDDVLATSKPRLSALCGGLKRLGVTNWTCLLRVDYVDDDIVAMLMDARCRTVSLGVESVSDVVLKSMNKRTTLEQINNALELCERHGLPTRSNLIFGDTEETYETAMRAVDWRREKIQVRRQIFMAMIRLYPGTVLYKRALASGKIKDPVAFLKEGLPLVNISKLSAEEYGKVRTIVQGGWINQVYRSTFMAWPGINFSYDFPNKKILAKARCKCGHDFETDISFSKIRHTKPIHCPNCHSFYRVGNPLYASGNEKFMTARLQKILKRHGKLAIWGLGMVFRNFINPDMSAIPGIYLVDGNPHGSYGCKPVEEPEVIAREDIPFVVVGMYPASQAYRTVLSDIRTMGTVQHIMSLYQLQDRTILLP